MHVLILMLSLLNAARSAPPNACAARLSPRDLQLEALSTIATIPEFSNPVWEMSFVPHGGAPFVFVAGPVSARKAAAIRALRTRVTDSMWHDVPTHSAAAFRAGHREFQAAAWVGQASLHVLDVGLARDFPMVDWQGFERASAALVRLGFSKHEVMTSSGIYLITP